MKVEAGPSSVVKPLKSSQCVFILNTFNKLSQTNTRLAVKQVEKLMSL
jgi:hypothetical protein